MSTYKSFSDAFESFLDVRSQVNTLSITSGDIVFFLDRHDLDYTISVSSLDGRTHAKMKTSWIPSNYTSFVHFFKSESSYRPRNRHVSHQVVDDLFDRNAPSTLAMTLKICEYTTARKRI
jgi:hypothetical protein